MLSDLLALWRTHETINRYMLDNIPDGGWDTVPLLKNGQPGKGRNVARVFLHMYDVRISHLSALDKKRYLTAVPAFEKLAVPTRTQIEVFLAASAAGTEARLAAAVEAGELIRKHPPLIWLGYLICHESHHRGQIILALKQNDFAPNEALRWGIWEKWFKP